MWGRNGFAPAFLPDALPEIVLFELADAVLEESPLWFLLRER